MLQEIQKVHIETNAVVASISEDSVKLKNGKEIFAKRFILATGGTSRPETGSTGDGFPWLKSLGHNIIDSIPPWFPFRLKTLGSENFKE